MAYIRTAGFDPDIIRIIGGIKMDEENFPIKNSEGFTVVEFTNDGDIEHKGKMVKK